MMVCKANIPGQVVYYNQINQHQKPEIDRFHDDQTDIPREAVGRKVQNLLESELQALLMALQNRVQKQLSRRETVKKLLRY